MTLCATFNNNVMPSYFEGLNEPQRAAVSAVDGPVLILAGAGTGKTRVLTTRLAHIIHLGAAAPNQILAVTFTNKAAQEMKSRVAQLLGFNVDGMWIGTFHALAVRILRRHAEIVGLQPNFTILDTDDQTRLLKQILKAYNLDDKQFPARSILSSINRFKDKGLLPDQCGKASELLVRLYAEYQERLRVLNATDFGDLLLHNLTIFKNHPDILATYHQQFRYLMVDEYQDTNVAQYLWLRLLAQGSNNICCVGDDDQSIYGWRGAEVGNILRFEKDYPGATVIRLEQNYRSTGHILAAASGLIAHNKGRLGKKLWTQDGCGEEIIIRGTWDSEDEARFIGDEVEHFQRQGCSLKSMAILVRAGFQTREFEERFLKLGVPYKVIGGAKFYERQEIRDALAYLRLLIQPDDGLAFERIINVPRRGIGGVTLQAIHELAREQGVSLPKAALFYAHNIAKAAAKTSLIHFFDQFDRWRRMLNEMAHVDVVGIILDESGYTDMWRQDKSPEASGRLENLKEFVRAIAEFQYIPGFLEHVSLVMDHAEEAGDDCIYLMTLHAAKGLEFKIVFLPGWEEALFPHPRCLQESGQSGLEEERRLAYVGISRARERAIITYSLNRRSHAGWNTAIPSRFIREIPEDVAVHINPSGYNIQNNSGSSYKQSSNFLSDDCVATHSFIEDDRIFHQKFGYGTIVSVAGNKLLIDFDHSGQKSIMADFITKA